MNARIFFSPARDEDAGRRHERLMKIVQRGCKRYLGLTFVRQFSQRPAGQLRAGTSIDEVTAASAEGFTPHTDAKPVGSCSRTPRGQALISFTETPRYAVIWATDRSPARLSRPE